MKKKKILILTIIFNFVWILCFIVGFITIKEAITRKIDKNVFVKHMQEKGCSVINLKDHKEYSGIGDYLITDKETCPYSISYTTFNNKKASKDFFSDQKKDVLKNNPNTRIRKSVSVNIFSIQYYEYTTSGDYYKSVVYSNNSVLYASANKQYSDDIIDIYNDLNYSYDITNDGNKLMFFSAFIILLIIIVSMWGIEEKIRNSGWIVLIPYYNIGCLSKDILGSLWYLLLLLFPYGVIIFFIILLYNIGKVFNKKNYYCLLTVFFPTVMCPLIAFDDSKYNKNN